MKLPGKTPPVLHMLIFQSIKQGYVLGINDFYEKIVAHYPHTNSILSTLDKEKNDLLSRLNNLSPEEFLSAMSSKEGGQE